MNESPVGSGLPSIKSGAPMIGINNQPIIKHVHEAPIHKDRPPMVQTGHPVIEITCNVCGELTARTYPVEAQGEQIKTAPDEKYSCSCPPSP